MLSRAPRLPQQKTTSNLGPGCYQPENHALITGKILGHDAYAPFSSLEKRTSAFDSFITNTPAPGNYDIEGLGFDYSKAPKFGKGTDRFNVVLNDSPGPNAYNIPETLKKKTVKKNINSFRLNPLLNVIDKVVEDMSRVSLDNIPEEETDAVSVSDIRGISALTKAPSIPPKRQKIIWKRKYIPPSIPRGDTAFGYQEGSSGELIPRQKPAQESYESLNYVSSFAERAIHDKKGYGFGKGTRIEPKIDSTPGPSHYQVVDKPSETGNRAAVLALSPCTRITDLEIKQELKRAIPGPGAYNQESPIDYALKQNRGRVNFGGEVDYRMKINANEIPGPGSYNTELSRNAESNGKGFGSTATRFRERVADNLPAPGAYEAAQAEFNLHLKKPFRGAQHKAFGSLSRRFRNLKGNSDPGPQTYNVQDDKSLNSLGFSTYNYMHHFNSSKHQDKEKVSKKILKRVRVVKIGNLVVDPVSAHVPVFGSQGDRFQAREVGYGPPPGIYDVNTAFKKLKNRGHVDPTFLSTLKSKFFESLEGPGPGFYDPIVASTSKRVADEGMFMSKEDRFQKQVESIVPAPNHYSMKERGLLKKTFNVSFK